MAIYIHKRMLTTIISYGSIKKQGVSPENVEKIKLRLNFAVINVL